MPSHRGLALAILIGCIAPASNAAAQVPFGSWTLGSRIQTLPITGPRQYSLSTETEQGKSPHPSFSLTCAGEKYNLEFSDPRHRSDRAWRGVMNIYLDRAQTRAVGAATEGPQDGMTFIVSVPLSRDDLKIIAAAHGLIEISFDGWANPMTFPAEGTAAAVRVLRAACAADPG